MPQQALYLIMGKVPSSVQSFVKNLPDNGHVRIIILIMIHRLTNFKKLFSEALIMCLLQDEIPAGLKGSRFRNAHDVEDMSHKVNYNLNNLSFQRIL